MAQEASTGNTPTTSPAKSAADDSKPPTISANVRVVNILATVRDKHGKLLPNLAVSNFSLEEDSRPVTIQYFARETDLPLTLGLLVDTSMSQRTSLEQERSASKTFLEQVLREKDAAFLIHFDREVELLQDLTSSRPKLESALDSLRVPSAYDQDNSGPGSPDPGSQRPSREDSQRQGRQRGYHRAGTTLYDGIYLASDELMSKQQGRKALIILSDGVDRGSKESLEGAIEAAQRSDTLVYSVLFKGEEPFRDRGGFGDPKSERIALLVECGQHWEKSSAEVAIDTTLRFLVATGTIAADWAKPRFPLAAPPAQRVIRVTEAVTAESANFRFAQQWQGLEIVPRAGTLVATDGDKTWRTPYDDCVMVMPSIVHLKPGGTAVRLGRYD